MAKAHGAKSAAVREQLAKNPNIKAKEIVATLKQQGIQVTPNMVYMLKSSSRRGRKRKAVRTAATSGHMSPVSLVIKVKNLARELGGLKNLKQLVDALAES